MGPGPFKVKNMVGQQKKKTTDVESVALQRVKNELKLRDARQDLAHAFSIMTRLNNDQKEMDARKKELENLVGQKGRKQQQILDETGVANFIRNPEKGNEINATLENLKHTCFMLHTVNNNLKQREIRSKARLINSRDSFYSLKLRNIVAKELLSLLFETSHPLKEGWLSKPHPNDSIEERGASNKAEASCKAAKESRSRAENRREQSINSILSLTENFHHKKRLNSIRCASNEWKEVSLEEYIDSNIKTVDIEIRYLSKEIQSINAEVRETCDLIEDRKLSISSAKKLTKQISKKNIAATPTFLKVTSHNESIQSELDSQLSIGKGLLEESVSLVADVEHRDVQTENSDVANQIRFLILQSILKEDVEIERDIEERDRKCEQLAQSIEESELTLNEMEVETKSLKLELEKEGSKLNNIRSSIKEMQVKNEAYVKVISQLSQRALEIAVC